LALLVLPLLYRLAHRKVERKKRAT